MDTSAILGEDRSQLQRGPHPAGAAPLIRDSFIDNKWKSTSGMGERPETAVKLKPIRELPAPSRNRSASSYLSQ